MIKVRSGIKGDVRSIVRSCPASGGLIHARDYHRTWRDMIQSLVSIGGTPVGHDGAIGKHPVGLVGTDYDITTAHVN